MLRAMLKALLIAPLLACLAGCAGFDAHVVNENKSVDGFPYYEVAPFLFVYSDGKGGLKSEIKFLPDTTRMRSIRPYAVLSSNESTLVFSKGTLTQAKETVDETAVASAGISALSKFLVTALPALNAIVEQKTRKGVTAPPPYLFKIVVDGERIGLYGGPPTGDEILMPVPVGG